MTDLMHKNFSDETNKKIKWVTKMYREWRVVRNMNKTLSDIECDFDEVSTLTKANVVEGVCRFLTEVKKLDGSEFPG